MKNETEDLKKKKFVFILIFAFGLIAGILAVIIYNVFANQVQNASTETREGNKQYTYINPLLECNIGADISNELELFKSKAQDEVNRLTQAGQAKLISVYFRDMNNGPFFGINANQAFIPASLLKVPVMMAYYNEAESNPGILNKQITFTKSLNPISQYFKSPGLVPGKTYTVEQLIEAMIENSDNDAYDLLLLNTDSNSLDDVFKYLDVNLPKDQLVLTVQQYATFFRILFNASYLTDVDSEHALDLLDNTKFTVGLRAGVPANIKVAHKFGEKWDSPTDDKQLHDCGIVYYPNHPYLLCVMTRGSDFNQLASVIADISKFVYNEVDSQAKQNN